MLKNMLNFKIQVYLYNKGLSTYAEYSGLFINKLR
ncbi:hypothetical protein SAMN05421545_2077 [Pontibacter lucknowensis]|uniref:Uncharacterized protein n=1 Tax=Pontibacter lucknowensis TaxID=1077936 RepID=A0A1N6XDC3_9BACT|nr:hypothetical protein SAMN05421545_2077 [Pontibacter lucknowensis]